MIWLSCASFHLLRYGRVCGCYRCRRYVLKLRLRELAGDGKVSSFECFSFVWRKYCNKDITLYHLNHLNYIKIRILKTVNLREKTLAIGHQFAKFANVFCYTVHTFVAKFLHCMQNKCYSINLVQYRSL